MLRLSFYKDEDDTQFDYYFDIREEKIYCFKIDNAVVSRNNSLLLIVAGFVGASSTLLQSFLKNFHIAKSYDFLLMLFLLLITAVIISFFYGRSIKKQENKIKLQSKKINFSCDRAIELFRKGKKTRIGCIAFILVILLLLYFFINQFSKTYGALHFVMLFFGVIGITIFIRILSPIQIIKFKLYIRRCKKECQNK